MKKRGIWLMSLLLGTCLTMNGTGSPVGWASVNALGVPGTVGGGMGKTVRVNSLEELAAYAGAEDPYVIIVEGNFEGAGMIRVTSNKTIIGAGAGAVLDRVGLEASRSENIIIRNLTIKRAGPDALALRTCHHVWIDHCDLSESSDGLLDLTLGSDFATVSWTRFHDHNKVSLANSGTAHFEDYGKENTTYHHNWFYDAVQRNPRVGYGKGHVFNNYYSGITSYCVGYHTQASMRVENNYFYRSAEPLHQMYTDVPTAANFAESWASGNIFDQTTGNEQGTGHSFDPALYYDYGFAMEPAAGIPQRIKDYSGPQPGLEDDIFPLPGNGALNVAAQPLCWTRTGKEKHWNVYIGTEPGKMSLYKVYDNKLASVLLRPGTRYFWRVEAVTDNGIVKSDLWQFRTADALAAQPCPVDKESRAMRFAVASRQQMGQKALTWAPACQAVGYRVYLARHKKLTKDDLLATTAETSYVPRWLDACQDYYWRVDALLPDGKVLKGRRWMFRTGLPALLPGRNETEHLQLEGNAFVDLKDAHKFAASGGKYVVGEVGPGLWCGAWQGPEALCTLKIAYYDENDGRCSYVLYVNRQEVGRWTAAADDESLKEYILPQVALKPGDEIRLEFATQRGELGKTDYIDIQINN
ncbi:MAG: hypothetical protein IJ154_07260 [Bacteroidales bacterium]|nr:hypothetical protein [Bacteroidales bacterium]